MAIDNRPGKTLKCEWFAMCTNPATMTRSHPILGQVPICKRCDDKMNKIEDYIEKGEEH